MYIPPVLARREVSTNRFLSYVEEDIRDPAGRSYTYVFLLWTAIAIGAAGAVATGYVGFTSLGEVWPPRLQAFGSGALLAMTAETIIPEAFHNSPRFSGLLAAVGFGLLLLVDAATR